MNRGAFHFDVILIFWGTMGGRGSGAGGWGWGDSSPAASTALTWPPVLLPPSHTSATHHYSSEAALLQQCYILQKCYNSDLKLENNCSVTLQTGAHSGEPITV